MPRKNDFMQYLERFYKIQKNSCTIMYIKIFLFSRNHSICQPKINLYELGCGAALRASPLSISLYNFQKVGHGNFSKVNFRVTHEQ